MSEDYVKGRGAQFNTHNRFEKRQVVQEHIEGLDEDFMPEGPATQYIEQQPKSIISKNNSPDVPFSMSINPYQGCEHGCIYCYARNSHEYWGYGAGLDFESRIIVKTNAPQLLEKALLKPSYKPEAISLSGNTDCYQPAEKKYQLTRQMLQIFLRYGHPVGIITKNQLIRRDIDILRDLAAEGLVHVYLSITTLDESLRRVLEPRTATATAKLRTIEALTEAGVPCGLMTAPVIPGLNSHELPEIIRLGADAGAIKAGYTMLRLNGQIQYLFKDWLTKNFPDRAKKVWNQVSTMHGGTVTDSNFGQRMRGQGVIAESIRQIFHAAVKKNMGGKDMPPYALDKFRPGGALRLF